MLTRIVIAAVLVVFAVAASALALGLDDDPPEPGGLNAIQDRIDWDALARQGIYVIGTGQSDGCVDVELLNPTRPNIDYIRARYGPHVCVARKPGGYATGCAGYDVSPRRGPIAVPDVRGLGLYEAELRLVAAGLTYTAGCLGNRERTPVKPSRYEVRALVRVSAQCPHAGQPVRRGTEVAIAYVAILPGGFRHSFNSFAGYHRVPPKPCADGRVP